ncbi:hypothetical protein NLI96_g5930 [Meripilus lineatus]|uniref:Uncharacterized protein n=1 Tax=Meripilus lineatus TaxID=2056292 RepID=A0AAD5V2P5_9APHY|nr:hypothetical protein NLI96_g5930 [Physisporinus lineatus]
MEMSRPVILKQPAPLGFTNKPDPLSPLYRPHTQFLEGTNGHVYGTSNLAQSLSYIPSLKSLCIRKLLPYPHQISLLGNFRLHYEVPRSVGDYDLLRSLMPFFRHEHELAPSDYKPSSVMDAQIEEHKAYCIAVGLLRTDPRLWATLIQLLDFVPPQLQVYSIPRYDPYLPLLQQIPSTPDFSLVAVLDLSGQEAVTNDTVRDLGSLHNLGALDLSRTSVTALGITRLSKVLSYYEEDDRENEKKRRTSGPWGLRVLYLKDCMSLEEDVLEPLTKFPLLSVIGQLYNSNTLRSDTSNVFTDLRGTPCPPSAIQRQEWDFKPSRSYKIFHPTPLIDVLRTLSERSQEGYQKCSFFSSPTPYFLHIDRLEHFPVPSPRFQALFDRSHLDNHSHFKTSPSASVLVERYNRDVLSDVYYVPTLRQHTSGAGGGVGGRAMSEYYSECHKMKRQTRNTGREDGTNPLMLFRRPPSWNTLEEEVNRIHIERTNRSNQRKKSLSVASHTLHGGTAGKQERAMNSLSAIRGMIERRKPFEGMNPQCRKPVIPEVRPNPFSRKTTKCARLLPPDAGHLPPLAGDTSEANRLATYSKRKRDSRSTEAPTTVGDVKEFERPKPEKSTLTLSPTAAKPLKPISSIPVPVLPPSIKVKPLPRPPSFRKQKSVGSGGVQTTLKTHFKADDHDGRGARNKDLSELSRNADQEKQKTKTAMKGKSKSGVPDFDWKAWGGGPSDRRKKMKAG